MNCNYYVHELLKYTYSLVYIVLYSTEKADALIAQWLARRTYTAKGESSNLSQSTILLTQYTIEIPTYIHLTTFYNPSIPELELNPKLMYTSMQNTHVTKNKRF